MNKMNRKVEYALMALKYMSQRGADQLTTAKEIGQTTGAPFDVISRVLQKMAQKKILKAELGAQGGYCIAKDLVQVSFLDLIEAVLSPVELVKCTSGQKKCAFQAQCNIQSPIQIFNSKLIEFYQSLSIAEILLLPVKGKEPWLLQTQI